MKTIITFQDHKAHEEATKAGYTLYDIADAGWGNERYFRLVTDDAERTEVYGWGYWNSRGTGAIHLTNELTEEMRKRLGIKKKTRCS